jgi:hypothetical protein
MKKILLINSLYSITVMYRHHNHAVITSIESAGANKWTIMATVILHDL